MCKFLVIIYLITRLISNVNCLFIDKSSLTHLDRLYFKHNKRHKFFGDKIFDLCYIQSCLVKTEQKNLHIEKLKLGSSDPGEGVGGNPHSKIPSFLRAIRGLFDQNESTKGRSPRMRPRTGGSRVYLKDKRGNFESQAKKGSDHQDPESKWMFRGKEKITDQISEYESLMSEIEDLSKSKNKSDKDLYSFIQKNLKESSSDPDVKLTTHDILRSINRQSMSEDLQEREWIKHIKRVRSKFLTKLEGVEKIPKVPNPLEVNMRAKAKEDACGFRYPIEGTGDEIFTEEDEYKFWGRTPVSAVESTHPKPDSKGKITKKERNFEDVLQSSSIRDQKMQEDYLKEIRESNFKARMDNILKWAKYKKVKEYTDNERGKVESGEENRYRNVEFENYYETFKRDFLNSDPESQEYVLKALNKYNPWDEYIKMKNLKSSLPQIGLNYKLNLKDLRVSFNSVESVSESEIRSFLREYLHYFLILESDKMMFEEFKNSKFLYDILKYFEVNEEIPEEKIKEYMDLTDKMFRHYFPKQCQEGFPKKPPEAEFPVTIEKNRGIMALNDKITGRINSYHRVNMVSCLMALARCYPLVREYSEDIFSEQRIRMMLDTIERGLTLELQRLEYGISEIQVTNLKNNSLCKVDGTFLSSLTEILLQWNIKHGIENILDLTLLITLRSMDEWDPKSLVRIIRNISYLTTLPESVYFTFLSKVMDFMHDKLKLSLLNKSKYMELEEGLEFLTLISRYPGMVTREFMEAFIQVYREEILNLKIPREGVDVSSSKTGSYNEDDDYSEMVEELEKKKEQTMGLISCLQLAGLKEYIHLLEEVTKGMIMENFEMNSTGLISVLETFNEEDEFQKRLITKTKNSLMRKKYMMDPGRVLRALEAYTRGVKEGRMAPDSSFFCTMMKQFCFLKGPNSEELEKAAQLTDEFSPHLNQKEISVIFKDLSSTPLYFNFLTRIGLRGEFLEYPIRTVAKVLYYSSKNNVVIEQNWKTFYEMIRIFKHILSIEDILIILDAMIATRFTKADELLEVLCKRVCNLIEITDVEPEKVLQIMNKCLELDYVPIHLLRFYTYCNMFEVQGSDHIQSLLDDRKDYDIDFRGWKRPRSYDSHTERVRLHLNVFPEIKMKGSRAEVPEGLKYSIQPPLKKTGHFDPISRKEVDRNVLKSLAEFVDRVGSSYKFSERDRNLINSLVEIVNG